MADDRSIPIRRRSPVSHADELVADFAFTLWLSSAFRGGLPEDALLTAVRTLGGKTSPGLFLVPQRRANPCPIIPIKSSSSASHNKGASRARG